MKVGLLAWLRCPSCRASLSLRVSHTIEVDRVHPRIVDCAGGGTDTTLGAAVRAAPDRSWI